MRLTTLARPEPPRCRSTQLNLVKLHATGYWFCQVCDRPTALNVDGTQSLCQFCHSPRVRFIEGAAKLLLLPLLLFLCLSAQAQSTFVNYRLNFVGGNASTNISVGTNTLARLVSAPG